MTLRRLAPHAAVALVAAPLAYWQIFTTFGAYDDEGYLLVSLQSFLDGGVLYRDVYTQYGPFYYELFGALFSLADRDVSTNSGRFIVIVVWLVTSGLLGVAMQRLTGRLLIGLASQIVAFGALGVLVLEPMHPVSLTSFLTVALVTVVVWSAGGRQRAGAIVAGATLAALILTKVNIGAFAVAAGTFALAVALPDAARHRWLRATVTTAFVALPLLLMRADLDEQWAQDLAFVTVAAAVALAVVTRGWDDPPQPSVRGLHLVRLMAGSFAAAAGLIIVVILALGTSISDFLDGVIAEPVRLRDTFTLPFPIPHEATDWALVSLATAIVVSFHAGRPPGDSPWPAILRVAAGVALWLSVTTTWPIAIGPGQGRLVPGVLLAWVAAVPPAGTRLSPSARFVRAFLPALAIAEALQAYPVAGTQITAGALVAVPVGALCVADGWTALERWSASGAARAWVAQACVAVAAVVVAKFAVGLVLRPMQQARSSYREQAALPFDGATRVHLPRQTVEELGRVVALVRARCSVFLTYPGMNSFYLWSYRKPPTGLNTTNWMKLLDDGQQQRIIEAVRDVPRLCAIRNREVLAFWTGETGPATGPLVTFIEQELTPQETIGDYELMVRKGNR